MVGVGVERAEFGQDCTGEAVKEFFSGRAEDKAVFFQEERAGEKRRLGA